MFHSAWEVDRSRVFENIGTWEEFLLDWNRNRTQLGAVGLLYGGTTVVLPAHVEERAREVARRLDFYLKWALQEEWAATPNTAIAVTAQQLIVKNWLKVLVRHVVDDCFSDSHQRLLALFHKRWPSLLAPPYPRFVADYLLEIHHVWQWGDPACKGVRLAIQNFTDLVVPALCVWGLGYVLAVDGARTDAAEIIAYWLRMRFCESSSAIRHISGYGQPLADFRQVDAVDEEVNTRAALALLKLRHLARREILTGSPTAPF